MIKEKKKRIGFWVTLGVIGFIVLLLLSSLVFVAVTMKNLNASIEKNQAEVVTAYKARNDAVAELVNELKPKMSNETKVFELLEKAEQELSVATDTKSLSEANIKVDAAVNNIIYVMIKKYYHFETPFVLEIEEKIDGARNRIVTECTNYNKVAKDYNFAVQNFPGDFIAKLADYEKVDLFQIVNYQSNTN